MITINGDIYITNYGQSLNELVEDEQFEDFDELDCDGDCEDCDLYESDECDDEDWASPFEDTEIEFDLSEDERFKGYDDRYLDFLKKYVKKMYSTNFCPYCLSEVLNEFLEDYFDNY